MTEIESELPAVPMPRTCPFEPPKQYAELREQRPVSQVTVPTGNTAWVIANHELVRQILADPRVSSDRTLPGCPRLVQIPPQMLLPNTRPLLAMDPPEHTVHRRLVTNEFTVKRISTLRPRIQEIVDGCVDELLRGERPVDLVAALSLPVPSLVICELLGVPYTDREKFQSIASVVVSNSSTPPEIGAAIGQLRAFLGELVAEKEEHPADDLLSRLVEKYREAGDYDRERVVSTGQILLIAGHETTANMISLGTVALLEHPEQLGAIREDPTKIPRAVEELLRYFSIADLTTFRTATADIEIGDVVIREGEGLIALGAAANRDPAAFENPDELDIERNTQQHVAFGHGVHQCLGQNLARLELEIVFTTLFSRIPDLRLAVPAEKLPYKQDRLLYGIYELPVEW